MGITIKAHLLLIHINLSFLHVIINVIFFVIKFIFKLEYFLRRRYNWDSDVFDQLIAEPVSSVEDFLDLGVDLDWIVW